MLTPEADARGHTEPRASAAKAAEIAASGLTPLDYMIGVMREVRTGQADVADGQKNPEAINVRLA